MKIEVGNEYMTRDGRRVTNVRMRGRHLQADVEGAETSQGYRPDGRWGQDDSFGDGHIHLNIVSEIPPTKSPIRTVTKREIVSGIYGAIRVSTQTSPLWPVAIHLVGLSGDEDVIGRGFTANEIREAANLFNQLAEFLENDG